jgi:hypothetical protein
VAKRDESDGAARDERDDELEAAVEAEYQESNRTSLAYLGSGTFVGVTPREAIRERLIRERREADEAELVKFRLAEAKRQHAEAASQAGKRRTRGSATYPRAAFNETVKRLRAGEDLAEIARRTGLHRNRIARIRDRYVQPRPDGPEYETVVGPIPNTVILRRRS